MDENIITEDNLLEEIKVDSEICPICLEELEVPCKTQCNHIICKNCIEEWFKNKKDTCPLCRNIIESYYENNERVKVIKIEDVSPLPDEDTERYMIFLRNILGRLRVFKYLSYISITSSLYFYIKYTNTHYIMEEYKNIFEICNSSLAQDSIRMDEMNDIDDNDEENHLSSVFIVIGDHMRRCLIPDKYISKCF
tara:strand:+ start:1166 stop:1747 length:582 start_codon:yes stop_codon:yes gene_type:complete